MTNIEQKFYESIPKRLANIDDALRSIGESLSALNVILQGLTMKSEEKPKEAEKSLADFQVRNITNNFLA